MTSVSKAQLDHVFRMAKRAYDVSHLSSEGREIVEFAERYLIGATAMYELERLMPASTRQPHLLKEAQQKLLDAYRSCNLADGEHTGRLLVNNMTKSFRTLLAELVDFGPHNPNHIVPPF